jgi:NADH dehydrogenase [ubiquinone] 1 alpha subcomplex assembly factor 6
MVYQDNWQPRSFSPTAKREIATKKIMLLQEKDLRVTQPRTLADIESYAENTMSSLFYLTLESVGVRDFTADHAASHLGKATGLITLIRAIPFQAKERQLYIPIELCAKHNIRAEDIFSGKTSPQLQEAVYEIANQAKSHLDLSRELTGSVRYPANVALLQAEWTDQYLLMLQKRDFNPFDDALRHNTMKQRLYTLKNYYLNKY